jgi:hypothetical protein
MGERGEGVVGRRGAVAPTRTYLGASSVATRRRPALATVLVQLMYLTRRVRREQSLLAGQFVRDGLADVSAAVRLDD